MLRAPVDDQIAELRDRIDELNELPDNEPRRNAPFTLTVEPRIDLHNGTVVSVTYTNGIVSPAITTSSWHGVWTTSVDLRTGERLEPADVFRPEVLTEQGLADLAETLRTSPGATQQLCQAPERLRRLTPDDVAPGGAVQFSYTDQAVLVHLDLPMLGYENACLFQYLTLPYTDVPELTRPDAVARLTAR